MYSTQVFCSIFCIMHCKAHNLCYHYPTMPYLPLFIENLSYDNITCFKCYNYTIIQLYKKHHSTGIRNTHLTSMHPMTIWILISRALYKICKIYKNIQEYFPFKRIKNKQIDELKNQINLMQKPS